MLLAIGLTGPPGSGKGSVVEIITRLAEEEGLITQYFSLSDEIRHEARRRGVSAARENLKQIADELRAQQGSHIWAALTATKVEAYLATAGEQAGLLFIDGLRNPHEVKEMRRRFGQRFKLLGITAPAKDIQRNLKDRNRGDEASRVLEDERGLKALVSTEMGQGEPEYGHNIAACLAMADWPLIHNDGSLADLQEKVRLLVEQYIFPAVVAREK
jgi:dephospho-CoA kinase